MARSKRRRIPAGAHDTFWDRLSTPARHGLCLALLLVLSLSFFAPIHFGGQQIHGGDVVSWRANAEAMLEYERETGDYALWAPNVFSGMPGYLIQYPKAVPQLDTVFNALRGFAWPTSHFFLLLAGAYFLVVYLTRNSLAGLLSAAAFGMTTYIPILLKAGHQTKFVALAFAPYVILAFVYAMRNPSLMASLLFGGTLALQLRAQHPQITYYVMMVIGIWWVVELVGAMRNDRSARLPKIGKSTGWLALGTVLALLMVAQPYLATYEYKAYTIRGAAVEGGGGGGGNMGWDRAMMWSQGPGELTTLAIADAYGGGEAYWGPKPFTEGPHYLGGIVLALAILALWRVRSNAVYGLGLGAFITTLFALGRHAAWINRPMFEFFPFFDAFRAPETWLSITALTLAVLAGIGLDYALTPSESKAAEEGRRRSVYISLGGAIGVVLLLLVANDAIFSFEQPNERQRIVQAIQQQRPDLSVQNPQVQQFIDQQIQQQKTTRQDTFQQDAIRTLLFLGMAVFLLGLYRNENVPRWAAGGLIALLVVVDLWGVGKRHLNANTMTQARSAEQEIATYGFDEFIKEQMREAGGPGHFRTLPLALNPTNNARASYHYEQTGGYHGAKLQRYQNYIDHILRLNQGVPNENGLDLMNTRYIIARQQLPGTRVAYRDEQTGMLVLENMDYAPRAYFVGQTEVIADPQQTWQRLRAATFAPQTTAILPEPIDQPVTPVDSASTTAVSLQQYTPREITWQVETDAPRLLVVSEVYYPAGWEATIDGEPAEIHRANYLLRAVHVPAGEHTVTMRFDPQVHQTGVWVSGVSTAFVYGGVLVLLGLPYARRRRRGDAESEEGQGGA
ncbi:MAG: YfhO family protein [Bacteroidetes bacterium]|jgi:hypothetical protein|nr:YfhO family protein [Bacteroidota bacterium]